MRITNKHNLPSQVVRCMKDDYSYKDKRYSVTNILSSPRETILKRRYNTHKDYTMDIADSVNLLLGNATHLLLENIALEPHELAEQHYTTKFEVNGFMYTFSGIVDYINTLEGEKSVDDYKTTSVYGIIYKSNYKKWKQQLEYSSYLHYKNTGQLIGQGKIIYFIKDWKDKDSDKRNYPVCPIGAIDFTFRSIEEIEQELQRKFEEIHELEKLSDDNLPVCSEEERWVITWGEKKGIDRKCTQYCNCNIFCNYWRDKYEID